MMHASMLSDEAGFTIIELMMGLCILALIATYALGSYQNIRRMNDLMDRVEARNAIEAVQSHLHDLLSRARPIAVATEGQSRPVVAFGGKASWLQLVAASDGTLETGGLNEITVETRARNDGLFDLVTTRRLLRSSEGRSEPLTLIEGIASLKFRFFGQGAPDESAKWHPEWIKKEVLPGLIEVSVGFPEGTKQSWPRFIARPASGS